MKNILKSTATVLLLFWTLMGQAQDGIKLLFKNSPVHGLYTFAQGVSGGMGASPTFMDILNNSKFANDTGVIGAQQLLSSVNLFYEFELNGYPEHRYNSIQLTNLITREAAKAENLNDFAAAIYPIMNPDDYEKVMDAMRMLEPVYRELIWDKSEKALKDKTQKYELASKLHQFSSHFEKAKIFYGSAWDIDIPFNVMLHPIFPYKGSLYLSATPEKNYITVSTNVEDEEVSEDLETIFHELAHVLYDFQSSKKQNLLEEAFLQHPSPMRYKAYGAFNEGIATALGQGYYSEVINGKLNEAPWYAVDEIDQYGKALFPYVKNYMNAGKVMDTEFIDLAIKAYEATFPDALSNIQKLFPDVAMLYDSEHFDVQNLFQPLFEHFKMRSIEDNDGLLDLASINKFKAAIHTKLMVIPANDPKYQESLVSHFPWLAKYPGQDEKVIINYDSDVPYFAFVVKDMASFANAIEYVKTIKELKPGISTVFQWSE